MKSFCQRYASFCLTALLVFLIASCAPYPRYEEKINIIVSPRKLSVHSGSEDKIHVQLLDNQGGPLFGMKVRAKSTSPAVATVTQEALTDAGGRTTFTVKGISPGTTNIIISANGYSAVVEVVFIEH
ncbi:MAG: carboxypeptidase-like regulatory domain-containing protein [Candidatus Loosdrechtia sp.]|uniref:carboxypeptidase-like regulatory domain-containing protein n=1 Tax=Candidatus Loosdrechtia sp. TaxID=3101272 RepID=UPI003A67DB34|nr:MAG: carboxypeptidase-like regulatory domain-containing protein [Candidatus Jettenia sp. AMX2]